MKILIVRANHGTKAVNITTDEAYQKCALAIVNERHSLDFYAEPVRPTEPAMKKSLVIKHLPAGEFRELGLAIHRRYQEANAKWEKDHLEWERIKNCIAQNDGATAIEILEGRKHLDMEGFEILEVRDSY